MEKERRNEIAPVKVYLTNSEHKKLESFAAKSGYSKSSYMRQIFNRVIPPAMPPKEFYDFTYELNKIGVNINQIAKIANMTGNIEADKYKENYEKLQAIISDIQNKYLMPRRCDNGND